MRPSRLSLVAWIGWLLLAAPAPAASPLAVVPDSVDLVFVVPAPKLLLDAATTPALFKQALGLAPVREILEGTRFRRFQQLLGHLERELGHATPELLSRVAGDGIALATKFGAQPPPTLLVVQGTDIKASERFFAVMVQIIEQELARQEGAPKLVHGSYQGIASVSLGTEAYLARSGATIVFANKKAALTAALDLVTRKVKGSLADQANVVAARKLLPPAPLAWLWLNMETVRKAPEAAEFYKTPREPLLTVLFGGYVDGLGRTPYLAAALTRDRDDFALTIRLPVGRDGMGPDRFLHVGPDGKPASRPLLEPKGVLYSSSFYLDTAAFWNERANLFGVDVIKGLEQADKGMKQFPFSRVQLSKLLTAAAPYHRIVVANQPRSGYTRQPATPIPAYAVVTEMTNPEDFAEGVETLARGGALFFSTQVKLKMSEEKVGDVTLVGWRFDETKPVPEDAAYSRFGYSPCFARVGNQMLLCSTLELARELIPMLQQEKVGDRSASVETLFHGPGFAELFTLQKEQLITQAILDQAVPAGEARRQADDFVALLRKTGGLALKATYGATHFEYEIRARLGEGK